MRASSRYVLLLITLFLRMFAESTWAQEGPFDRDLAALTKSAEIANNVYANKYIGFSLLLTHPPCQPKLNASVDVHKGHAILLDCVHFVKGWDGMYTFTIALDYTVNHPSIGTPTEYLASLVQAAERDHNYKAIQTDRSYRIASLAFSEAVGSRRIPEGTYYQGISCTRLKAYFLCFEAEASSVDVLRKLINLDQRLKLTNNQQ